MTAPHAKKVPYTRSFHGRTFVDNYEWMRDKDAPETRAYLEAQNEYADARTAGQADLREAIFSEIKARTKETDMSVPTRFAGYWFYSRTEEGKDYPILMRARAADDSWTAPAELDGEAYLDVNELAAGHEFFSLGTAALTRSGRLLAYSCDTTGDERFDLVIKDLSTGEMLPDRLENIFYGAAWVGEEYLFYQRVDEAWRPDSVWRHRIGTPQSEDVQIFHEADERFFVGVSITRSRQYLFIESGSKLSSETWVLPVDDPTGEPRLLWAREENVEYSVDHAVVAGEERWLVTHNALGPNFSVGHCLATLAPDLPALRDLTELVPHRATTRVEGVDVYRDQIVLAYRREAIPRVAIMRLTEGFGEFTELDFPEELYAAGLGGSPEWEAPVLSLGYTSFTQPSQVFDYVVATGERRLLKEQEVEGGYDPSEYTAYRVWATAPDGEQIPVSVMHRADLDLTAGPHPALLYGYGAYEMSNDPFFSIARLSLLDRGMIFAVAHVRGGGEMGRRWYDEGKQLQKKNTFTDFIAAADELIARGLTAPDRLVGEGGSAGGLLIGAVANLAPDRFAGLLALVPFVDPLTSILKPELPLTVTEWDEWGDPFHDPEVYDYMATYAPYENVAARSYPDILACTSLNDTRVLYVEPAKWVAKLQDTAVSGEFLLKTEMVAGHGGVSGRYNKWKQTAFEWGWAITKATSYRG